MACMRAVGNGHRLPSHAKVREDDHEYVIELDVSDFLESELSVETVGRHITVRGDQLEEPGDDSAVLRLHERIEESFWLPEDAVAAQMKVFYTHGALEIHAPRTRLEARRVPLEHVSPYVCNPNAEPC